MEVQGYPVENQVPDAHVRTISIFFYIPPFIQSIELYKKNYHHIVLAVYNSGGGNRRRFGRKFVGFIHVVC